MAVSREVIRFRRVQQANFVIATEHGPDSQAMLVLLSPGDGTAFLDRVEQAIEAELSQLPRQAYLKSSLSHSHGKSGSGKKS